MNVSPELLGAPMWTESEWRRARENKTEQRDGGRQQGLMTSFAHLDPAEWETRNLFSYISQ